MMTALFWRERDLVKTDAAMAEILKREGVKYLFGYPRNALLDAAAQKDIRTIIVRQERTGLHMADAVSRMTAGDTIGVFAMQHGPGSENAFGGVAGTPEIDACPGSRAVYGAGRQQRRRSDPRGHRPDRRRTGG